MALGILAGAGVMEKRDRLACYLVMGELALDGRIKPIKGALPSALLARARKMDGIVLPRENAAEASVIREGVAVIGVENLQEAVEFFEELRTPAPVNADLNNLFEAASRYDLDFSEVKGQEQSKRARSRRRRWP
jgi:magnesium chelatase family protein